MALLFVSCQQSATQLQSANGFSMGTTYSIKFYGSDRDKKVLDAEIRRYLVDFNEVMSTYLDDSELNQFNQAPLNQWVQVSNDLFEVVSLAYQVSEQTQGAYDFTVAPLVDLWGIGPKGRPSSIPSQDVIELAKAQVGYQAIQLDASKKALLKTDYRFLDLSSIAKGYAVDKVAQLLEQRDIHRYLVEIGGEMRIKGLKDQQKPWVVAIETPDSSTRDQYERLELTDISLATSGDYRNYFEQQGQRYSHTLDPASGYPIAHSLASVTVLMPDCVLADAYATAFNVLGLQKAKALARQLNLAVFFIEHQEGEFIASYTDAFAPYFPEE